jgi:hypothetical protein
MGGELKILDGVLASVEIVCCAVSFVGFCGCLWVLLGFCGFVRVCIMG